MIVPILIATFLGGGVCGFGIHYWLAMRMLRKASNHIPAYMVAYRQSIQTLVNWLENVPNKSEVAIRRDAESLAVKLKGKLHAE